MKRTGIQFINELPTEIHPAFKDLYQIFGDFRNTGYNTLYEYFSSVCHLFKYTKEGEAFWKNVYNDIYHKRPKTTKETKQSFLKYFNDIFKREPNFLELNMFKGSTRDNYYIFCEYGYHAYANTFHNCQNFTLSPIEDLLQHTASTLQQKKDFIQKVAYNCGKRILICDINTSKIPLLKELYPNFLFSTNYHSTNDSLMTIVGIVVN